MLMKELCNQKRLTNKLSHLNHIRKTSDDEKKEGIKMKFNENYRAEQIKLDLQKESPFSRRFLVQIHFAFHISFISSISVSLIFFLTFLCIWSAISDSYP